MAETRETQVLEDVVESTEIENPRTTEEAILAQVIAGDEVTINARTRLQKYLSQLKGGGSPVIIEPITIIENGTRIAPEGKAYSPVTVEVDGYLGNTLITGTLGNPWGDLGFNTIQNLINNANASLGCRPGFSYDASAIGAGSGDGSIISATSSIRAYGASVGESTSRAFTIVWNENGLVSAYMEQNGVTTDISAYAALISMAIALPKRLMS